MISIVWAKELGEKSRERMSEIFVEGFGEHLSFFSKDQRRLSSSLEHMFNLEQFSVVLVNDEIAGIAACTNGKDLSVKLNKKELRRHLGFYKGSLASYFLGPEFEKPPIETGEKLASIEFVATAAKYRKAGIATELMNHFIRMPQYDEYILEVADTNINAVKLYEKLGFKEFRRIKQKHSKRSGVNALVYMKYQKI